eukprot:TRINITY_DN16385_c1_g1_i2.p1 TRINITY_DN16385_c1_g1~~TRINITY_DN16385_c1_g1_i2.p1  ORF type:complete len:648 (+),score=77.95 TRINITY_DN16385_c1_g1_i2:170-2113(+)
MHPRQESRCILSFLIAVSVHTLVECRPRRIASRRIAFADVSPAQDVALAEWSRQKKDMLTWMDSWVLRQERLLHRALSSRREHSVSSRSDRDSQASLPSLLTVTVSAGKLSNGKVKHTDEAEGAIERETLSPCRVLTTSESSNVESASGSIPGRPIDEACDAGQGLRRACDVNDDALDPFAMDPCGSEGSSTNNSVDGETGAHLSRSLSQAERLEEVAERLKVILEPKVMPKRTGRLAQFVESNKFVCLCTMVIFVDTAFTAVEANRSMANPGVNAPRWTFFTDVAFTLFYSVELLIKLHTCGWYYFCNEERSWNLMDFVLVLQGASDIVLTLALSGDGWDVTFLRLLKLVKLGKILRIFRAIRFLRELRVMLLSIVKCLSILFWAFVMMSLIMYVFALVFLQLFAAYFDLAIYEDRDTPERDLAVHFFGDIGLTMISLFQGASGGVDWHEIFDVVKILGPLGTSAFIFFIGFFQFAVVNILGGVFLENALAASLPDRDAEHLEQRRAEEAEAEELRQVFSEIIGSSNTIVFQDLMELARDPHKKMHLRTLGLDINDAVMFFEMMTAALGVPQLPVDDFVGRLCGMKGAASAIDLQAMAYELTIVRSMVQDLLKSSADSSTSTTPFKLTVTPATQHRRTATRLSRII